MKATVSVRLFAVLAALVGACGFRTEPSGDDDGTIVPIGPDPREGSCDNPFVVPYGNAQVRGRLLGPGRADGWCGDGDNDAGAEDTYLLSAPISTEVLVFVTPDTEFEPTIRVTRDGCYADPENVPRVCVAPIPADVPYLHFLAEVGHEYSLTIDSPEGTDGLYGLEIYFSEPGLDACPIHPSIIDQERGGFFTWSNTFSGRQGRVDGFCGGPGIENMFQINVFESANFEFTVRADESFAPIISLRTGCGAATELICTSAELQGSSTIVQSWFFDPGTYYVVVDQNDVVGGSYELQVRMD